MTSRRKSKERRSIISEYWTKPTAQELDVVDKGDHLEVNAVSKDVAGWWLGTLRNMYPQDHYSGSGDTLKMHPEIGVTLKLNRNDGTLTIKGRKHWQWFRENFEEVLERGERELLSISEMNKVLDRYLRIDDGYTVPELLDHLPQTGSVKHSPTYIYRLWKGLLDKWISGEGKVYVITPLFDAKRFADVLLILLKHRLSESRVLVYTTARCDGVEKFAKVFKCAKEMLRDLKNPNNSKKPLFVEDRLTKAVERMEVKIGTFHCKMIACVCEEYTEMLLTSASFHQMHFQYDHVDTVFYMRLTNEEFMNNYLNPLGLAPQYGSTPLLIDPRASMSTSST